jgi:CRISPR-associated protein Csm3
MMNQRVAPLYGRVFVKGDVRVVTGLHIGAAASALNIGGVDNAIVRDPLTNQPYIPGSSLRGKMRSLSEKFQHKVQNWRLQAGVRIHICRDEESYRECDVCRIFGVLPTDEISFSPTRLVLRDVSLSKKSAKDLEDPKIKTDMPYTEVKWEATIDRVTSAAVPRQMERVPAGAIFDEFEMVYSVYGEEDVGILWRLIEAMQLLEDDYLGGMGSRGSGKIAFEQIKVSCRSARNGYGNEERWLEEPLSLTELWDKRSNLAAWVRGQLFGGASEADEATGEG